MINAEIVVARNQVGLMRHFLRSDDQERAAGYIVTEPATRIIHFNETIERYVADVIRMAGTLGWEVAQVEKDTGGRYIVRWRKMVDLVTE